MATSQYLLCCALYIAATFWPPLCKLASSTCSGGHRWPKTVTEHMLAQAILLQSSPPPPHCVQLYVFYPGGRWEWWVEVRYLRHQIWTILGWKALCCRQIVCVDFQHCVSPQETTNVVGEGKHTRSQQSLTHPKLEWLQTQFPPPTHYLPKPLTRVHCHLPLRMLQNLAMVEAVDLVLRVKQFLRSYISFSTTAGVHIRQCTGLMWNTTCSYNLTLLCHP